MTETPGAKTTVTFQSIEVTATKDRLWHLEAAGRSASAEFLDQTVDLVLPRLSYDDRDNLLIRLLMATGAEPPRYPHYTRHSPGEPSHRLVTRLSCTTRATAQASSHTFD